MFVDLSNMDISSKNVDSAKGKGELIFLTTGIFTSCHKDTPCQDYNICFFLSLMGCKHYNFQLKIYYVLFSVYGCLLNLSILKAYPSLPLKNLRIVSLTVYSSGKTRKINYQTPSLEC